MKIDKYKYMNKASNGIIMIKPEEDLKKHEDNKQYRSLEDVLYNIDDIADNCEIIGIGVDPRSGEVFNTDALAYPYLPEVLKYIEKKYINIPVVISATVDSVLNYEQTYYNLSLNIDLYNIENLYKLKDKKNLPNINCFYIPYPQNPQINFDELDLLYPNIYYFYCCKKRNKYEYLGYIDEMNKRNNIIFLSLEKIMKYPYLKIQKIYNKNLTAFRENDYILELNNIHIFNQNILYNYLSTTDHFYNYSVLRKNKNITIECDKLCFLDNIVLEKDYDEDYNRLLTILKYSDINQTLILYPDYNYTVFSYKLNNLHYNCNHASIKTHDIFEEKNICLLDIKLALQKYRKLHPDKIITKIIIPQRIIVNILNNDVPMALENFQQDTITYIVGF